MCVMCYCDPKEFRKNFDYKVEPSEKGVTISITAKDPEKAEALKKLAEAHQVLCGEDCCG